MKHLLAPRWLRKINPEVLDPSTQLRVNAKQRRSIEGLTMEGQNKDAQ